MGNLKGKGALITGAARGRGRGRARALHLSRYAAGGSCGSMVISSAAGIKGSCPLGAIEVADAR
jgi:NAD(P)-dependent dehydrogenase (short-subunit alcohol dehydrogenase family)